LVKCLFCESELTDDTKPEHILLNALGGRKTSRRLICSSHNQAFGGSVDKAMAEQVAVLRNMLQLDSGTGKDPPMLKGIDAGGEKINFRSDGVPELGRRSQDHVRGERSHLSDLLAHLPRVAPAPANVDLRVAADRPARLLQSLQEPGKASLPFRTVGSQVHEHADAPHPLALLRAHRERPRNNRAPSVASNFRRPMWLAI
jgi:hypothetical protein